MSRSLHVRLEQIWNGKALNGRELTLLDMEREADALWQLEATVPLDYRGNIIGQINSLDRLLDQTLWFWDQQDRKAGAPKT
jgi:hypothetical protein